MSVFVKNQEEEDEDRTLKKIKCISATQWSGLARRLYWMTRKRGITVPFPVLCTSCHSSVCSMNYYHHILMKYTSRLHTRSLLSTWWQRALEIATSSSQLKCRVDFKAHGYGPRFLPRPELFPIQGCFEDPAAYLCEDGHNCRASGRHYNSSTRWLNGDGPNPPWHKGLQRALPLWNLSWP